MTKYAPVGLLGADMTTLIWKWFPETAVTLRFIKIVCIQKALLSTEHLRTYDMALYHQLQFLPFSPKNFKGNVKEYAYFFFCRNLRNNFL